MEYSLIIFTPFNYLLAILVLETIMPTLPVKFLVILACDGDRICCFSF